jgi:hypothetical protein
MGGNLGFIMETLRGFHRQIDSNHRRFVSPRLILYLVTANNSSPAVTLIAGGCVVSFPSGT